MKTSLHSEIVSRDSGQYILERERMYFEFTERICDLMNELDINRTQLANRLGVNKSRISQILSGEYYPTLGTMSDIFVALGRAGHVTDTELEGTP